MGVVVIFGVGGVGGIYGSVIFKAQCYQSEILKFIIKLQHRIMEVKLQENIYGQNCEDESVQNKTSGSWTFDENILYVVFLQKNKVIMQSKKKRKNLRIFDQMSEFVGTRTSLQCRSHHQKFLEKLGDIKTIVTNFKKFISKEDFRARYQDIMASRRGSGELQGSIKTEQMEDEADAEAGAREDTAKGEQNSCQTKQRTVRQCKDRRQNSTSNSQHQIQEDEPKNPGFRVMTPQPRQNPFVVMDNSYMNIPLINMYLQGLMQCSYL